VAFFRKIKAGLVKDEITDFVGDEGNIFFNVETGELRLSDGVTPGGLSISGVGGAIVSETEPSNPDEGAIWYKESTNELSVFGGFWSTISGGGGGPRGFTGSSGYTGSQGFTGSSGAVGFTGSAGTNGFTGSAGTVGFTGSAGTNGFTGSQGFTGSSGAGFTGSKGDTGFTGSKGDTGFTGSSGAGFTGSQGIQGIQGYTGSSSGGGDGYTGSRGFTGSAGTNGFTGSAGTVGFTGSSGLVNGLTSNNVDTITVDSGYTIVPANNGLQNLGSPSNRFGTVYVGSNSVDIGGTVLSVGAAGRISLRDSNNNFTGFVVNDIVFGDAENRVILRSNNNNGLEMVRNSGTPSEITFNVAVGYAGSQGFTGSSGLAGFTGSQGPQGSAVTITGTLNNVNQLPPTGSNGQAYLIDGNLHTWTGSAWTNVGQIQGPTGYTGSQGVGYTGSQGNVGYTGSVGEGYTGSKGDLGYTGSQGQQGLRGYTGSGGGGGGGAFGNFDGGHPDSNYGGIASIDAGGVTA